MNKQEIATKIWSGANALRGKVSAARYKDYMLSLIFYKYLCKKEVDWLLNKNFYSEEDIEKLNEDNEVEVNNIKKNLGYFISYDNLFSTWIKKGDNFSIADIRKAISAFNDRGIHEAYEKVFLNAFSVLANNLNDLGSDEGARSKSLRELMKVIKDIPTDGNEDYDVLGFIYEFLLKNFAANAGKAGEFYTPYEASEIMSEIIAHHLRGRDTISIYDPTSGSGSLLLNIGKSVSKQLGDPNKIRYFAQELMPDTYNLSRMNLIMRGILPNNIEVRCADTLASDWPLISKVKEGNNIVEKYTFVNVDAVASNPPYSQAWTPKNDKRFDSYGLAPKSKADYAFLLHSLYHLKEDGIMAIVLPHGVLFRGDKNDGSEGEIRRKLLENNNIETIIGLPSNCFYGTGIPVIIMILKKVRTESDVLFVDASRCFIKDGNKNKLRAKDIRKIVDTVLERKDVLNFARLVSFDEICSNDYNLNLARYIDSSDKGFGYDLFSTMCGYLPYSEINSLDKYWKQFPTLKEELFDSVNKCYCKIKNDDVNSIVLNNKEVNTYNLNFRNVFDKLPTYLKLELIDNLKTVNISIEEDIIAKHIKEMLKDFELIDYYDVYEKIDEMWKVASYDIISIQNDESILNKTYEMKEWKKSDKSKILEEKVIREEGTIFSYDLIQKVYFEKEKKQIDDINSELGALVSNKEELLDSIDSIDKAELLKDDSNSEINTKKLNAKIARIKKEIKKGAEFEEGSYEDIILKINDVNEKIKNVKKELKEKKKFIEQETKNKLVSISYEESMELLSKKWFIPLSESINNLLNDTFKDLILNIKKIESKYDLTLEYIDDQINNTENELFKMLNELSGDEYDNKGIEMFKASLDKGNKYGQ